MNAQNIEKKPTIKKETKNKIRVDFERTSLKERLKAKYFTFFFLKKVIWFIFRFILLLGISYVVLFPFFSKIAGSFMSPEDFVDVTVILIPKHFTLDIYKAIVEDLGYWEAFTNTLLLSSITALLQTFVCCLVAYGLAKFKFKGNKFVFLAVILTMLVPHPTLHLSMFMNFRYFDIFGIVQFLEGGGITIFGKTFTNEVLSAINVFPDTKDSIWRLFSSTGINLTNTFAPMIILSITGLAFKNGLYIFMLRQFFRGVPDELEESAYIDGSGTLRTFIKIILPLSIPMMITVFLFAFSWQWTDSYYTTLFFTTSKHILMPDIVNIPDSLVTNYAGQTLYYSAIRNTCGLMIIAPLVVIYVFCQRFLVQGIERSGITG
jgi:multiple sugar transport system permease protein